MSSKKKEFVDAPEPRPKQKITREHLERELADAQRTLENVETNKQRLIGLINHTRHLLDIGDFGGG